MLPRGPSYHRIMRAAFVIVIMTASVAFADASATHDCVHPYRPADVSVDADWNVFLGAVDAYRACISTFVDHNYQASDQHRIAANAATNEWNAFVRAELNVPEDFPWPPKTE